MWLKFDETERSYYNNYVIVLMRDIFRFEMREKNGTPRIFPEYGWPIEAHGNVT